MTVASAQGLHVSSYPFSDLDQLEHLWRTLETGPDMTIFQSWDWHCTVARRLNKERLSRAVVRNRVYVVTRDDEPLLIAPLRIHKTRLSRQHHRGAHFIGREGAADYLNFIYREFSPEACELALSMAASEFHEPMVTLERILESTQAYDWLKSTKTSVHDDVGVAVHPQLDGTFAAGLSKRTRQNVRTARNRLEKDGHTLVITFGRTLDAADIEQFARLKASRNIAILARGHRPGLGTILQGLRDASRKVFFTPSSEVYDLAGKSADTWHLKVQIDDELAAFALGFVDSRDQGGTLRVTQVAFDATWGRYSPGLLGLHELLSRISSGEITGFQTVDLTRGEEPYKYALGGTPHTLTTFQWRL